MGINNIKLNVRTTEEEERLALRSRLGQQNGSLIFY